MNRCEKICHLPAAFDINTCRRELFCSLDEESRNLAITRRSV